MNLLALPPSAPVCAVSFMTAFPGHRPSRSSCPTAGTLSGTFSWLMTQILSSGRHKGSGPHQRARLALRELRPVACAHPSRPPNTQPLLLAAHGPGARQPSRIPEDFLYVLKGQPGVRAARACSTTTKSSRRAAAPSAAGRRLPTCPRQPPPKPPSRRRGTRSRAVRPA